MRYLVITLKPSHIAHGLNRGLFIATNLHRIIAINIAHGLNRGLFIATNLHRIIAINIAHGLNRGLFIATNLHRIIAITYSPRFKPWAIYRNQSASDYRHHI